jgi:hypothetical protein
MYLREMALSSTVTMITVAEIFTKLPNALIIGILLLSGGDAFGCF